MPTSIKGAGYHVDPAAAQAIAVRVLTHKGLLAALVDGPAVTIDADGAVTVTASRRVAHIFGRALPAVPRSETVHATATAFLERR